MIYPVRGRIDRVLTTDLSLENKLYSEYKSDKKFLMQDLTPGMQ